MRLWGLRQRDRPLRHWTQNVPITNSARAESRETASNSHPPVLLPTTVNWTVRCVTTSGAGRNSSRGSWRVVKWNVRRVGPELDNHHCPGRITIPQCRFSERQIQLVLKEPLRLEEFPSIDAVLTKKRRVPELVSETQHPLLGAFDKHAVRHGANKDSVIPFLPVASLG